jgi:hypothetical protein
MPDTQTTQERPIPVLLELGDRFRALEDAAPARRRLRRPRGRLAVALAVLAVGGLGGGAAAAGLFHFGKPIAPPPPGDVPPTQIPLPTTATVEPVTSPDPDGGPPWGIRVARNKGGEPCFAVNRVLDGKLGTVSGTELHELPLTGPGACGPAPEPLRYEVMQGFGRGTDGGRTTVGGLVSGEATSVVVNGPGGARKLEISPHGAFVTVYKGVLAPRDVPLTITLKDGSTQSFRAPGVAG